MQSLRDVLQNLRPQLSPIRRLRNSSLGGHLLVQRNAPGLVIRYSCSFVKLFYSTKRIVTSLMGLGFTESEWSRVSFKEERATIICIHMGLNNFNLVKLIPKVVAF